MIVKTNESLKAIGDRFNLPIESPLAGLVADRFDCALDAYGVAVEEAVKALNSGVNDTVYLAPSSGTGTSGNRTAS